MTPVVYVCRTCGHRVREGAVHFTAPPVCSHRDTDHHAARAAVMVVVQDVAAGHEVESGDIK